MAIIGEIYFKIGKSSTLNPYAQKKSNEFPSFGKSQIPDPPEFKFAQFILAY